MNNLQQVFQHGQHGQYGRVRVVMRADEPLFVGKDVCAALEISNYKNALHRLDEDERELAYVETPGGRQIMSMVTESGLYHLIFMSRKKQAQAFRKWVTSEVLPALRRMGRYELPNLIPEQPTGDTFTSEAVRLVNGWLREYEGKWLPSLLALPKGE